MKKLLLTAWLFLIFFSSAFSQSYKYGWISDIHIGAPGSESDLENVIHDINSRKDISFVVVTGDIAEKGRNDELEIAKSILDSLNVPYHIIPGNHDTKWSESGCTKFKELWKDDKFDFQYDGVEHIGMNSGIPWRGGGGHFAVEDLPWLNSVLAKTPEGEQIIFYAHHPLDGEIDNWFEVTNRLKKYNIKAILVGHGHANKLMNFGGIPAAMGRSTLSYKKSWGYTLVDNEIDSLFFYEVTSDSIPKFWGAIGKINSPIPEVDSTQFINYTTTLSNSKLEAEVLWQKELNTTLSASLLVTDNNIYAAAINGNVYCYDLSGNLIWENKTGETIFSRPVEGNGILAVGTIVGDLITIDASTGKIIQTIGIDEPITSQLISMDIEYNGQATTGVVLGTAKGSLYCYDINSLEMIWENHSAQGMIETKPLLIDDRIIYGSWDNYLYCIDSRSGIINWKWTENKNFYYSPAACWPATDGKNVYVSTPDKFISAIDLMLGTTVWHKNIFDTWETIGISDNKENLLIKSYDGNFNIASAKTGKLIKNIKIGFGIDTMPIDPIEWNSNIIFGSKDGKIYLIDKNYNWQPLFFLGTCRVQNVFHIKDNIFAASNMDGKIVVFKIGN
ncbi:MAG: PQQ-binding-like beta-propeller repeat protein [Bacteroidetes bacterium]|nr:PQQ-binding-like beta-propeller repeat protein [Bacteroidota bacterium]